MVSHQESLCSRGLFFTKWKMSDSDQSDLEKLEESEKGSKSEKCCGFCSDCCRDWFKEQLCDCCCENSGDGCFGETLAETNPECYVKLACLCCCCFVGRRVKNKRQAKVDVSKECVDISSGAITEQPASSPGPTSSNETNNCDGNSKL